VDIRVDIRVDIVLPCLDEARALPAVLAGLPPGVRAIVVDNGSRDGSADVARAHGAVVVAEPRRGFGSACAAGLAAATAPVVAFCDADGSLDLRELPAVTGPVERGEADLVLGRRMPTTRSAWPLHARAANRWLAAELRRRTGAALHDLGPMRAARREDLIALGVRDRRSGYPLETVLLAGRAGWRIAEVPVAYRPRTGRSKVTGTVRGTLQAVADMRRALAEVPA
jgi:glycosyltransferase involved in cell wall biosynthesis